MIHDKKGSVMVLVIIIIAVVTALTSLMLSIAAGQFKIRKSNSELRRAFYLSEDGLNKTYLNIYELMCDASEESLKRADEYLTDFPENYAIANEVFVNSYKRYIIDNISGCAGGKNPHTKIANEGNLFFVDRKLVIEVKSTYFSESGINRYTAAKITVCIPVYEEVMAGDLNTHKNIYYTAFDF